MAKHVLILDDPYKPTSPAELARVAAHHRLLFGPCPRDTDGDGNCGRLLCPHCGGGK